MNTAIKDLSAGDVVRIQSGKRATIVKIEPAPFIQASAGSAVIVLFDTPDGAASEIVNGEDKVFRFED
jgi:hypothetical protein